MKSIVCVLTIFVGAVSAFASATYDAVSQPGDLIVTVDSGSEVMDPAQVTEGVTNIIKRGAGTLTAAAISSYEGVFTIEKGVYEYDAVGDFGAVNSKDIWIGDGASIQFKGNGTNVLKNKVIHLSGAPATGLNGKMTSIGSAQKTIGNPFTIIVEDDSIPCIYSKTARYVMNGVFDLKGRSLEIWGNQISIGGVVTNGGEFVVHKNTTLMAEDALTFAADRKGVVRLESGATHNLKDSRCVINGWSLVSNGAHIRGNTTNKPTQTGMPYWDGPIAISNASSIASFEGGYGQSNSVYNVKGPLTGSGTLNVGPGWLNLHNEVNDYTGQVTVKGMSDNQVPSSSNAPVPPGGGGIGVWNGAACFPKASSITFGKSARFALMDDVRAELPVFTFNDSTYDQSFTGGAYTNGQRSVSAGIIKTGASTLTLDSPVSVTGRVQIAAGTLKIPARAKAGNRGLREYNIRSNLNAYNGDIAAGTKPWEKTTGERLTVTDNGVVESGPRKILSGIERPAKDADGNDTRHGYWYTGYVWNRSPTNETWQILTDYSNPNISVYVGENHQNLNFLQQQDLAKGKTNLPVQVVLEPGPTRVDLWLFTWAGGVVAPGLHAKKGLSFVRGPSRPVSDFQVDDATYWEPFVVMENDDLGLLFTTDTAIPEDVDASFDPLPVLETLEMAAGTTLDLDGNMVFRLGSLAGSPTVVNAPYLAVTNCWTLRAAETDAVLSTDGRLVFAPGSTFAVDDEQHFPIPGEEGRVVASAAQGVDGLPESTSVKWRLELGADGKSLVLNYIKRGSTIIIR